MNIKKLLIEPVLLKPVLLKPVLLKPVLLKPVLLKPVLLKPVLLKALKSYNHLKLYNHFKGLKRAFNSNIYKSIKLNRFRLLAMLERLKRGTNKIFILNNCKKDLIKIKIIIKIILLINDNRIIIPDKFTKD